ncbi:hypothetical protein ACFFU8_09030 [Chromobacterium piscinae]|uniref:hypothetical protein n=1 Tax=Chromobacterium piscinae TaxID=686831 RepID=UPI001E5DE96E|nr:hypothetical protein [Chromobacterium piscinae]MCD5327953.1 hypothetical protein [Chromobacterium piscinae]
MKQESMNNIAIKHIQSVLSASDVMIHTAGRSHLADRSSLCFIADQALKLQRPGFMVDGAGEKYRIEGGLLSDELDDLFRTTAGHQAEHELRLAVHAWISGQPVSLHDGFSAAVRKNLQMPVSVGTLTKIADALCQGQVFDFAQAGGARPLSATQAASMPPAARGVSR